MIMSLCQSKTKQRHLLYEKAPESQLIFVEQYFHTTVIVPLDLRMRSILLPDVATPVSPALTS